MEVPPILDTLVQKLGDFLIRVGVETERKLGAQCDVVESVISELIAKFGLQHESLGKREIGEERREGVSEKSQFHRSGVEASISQEGRLLGAR